ncbi:MAG: hypothetical protein B6I25_03005 [Planctomycetales bacterium 4572_13]|nr:MAG: hypothetical protein B6I25_03005 [Planctomycetales bacterium 4572_13]
MRTANKIIVSLAGLLLIVAAVLKFHEMIATCVPSWRDNPTGFWESYEFFLVQIPLEFALGVWLVSGLFRKASWIVGTLAFLGFIGVTISKIVTGAESCGCFGQITVNPRITLFVMDIPIFLMLVIFRPKGYKLLPPPWPNVSHMLAVAVPVLAVMALAAPAMITLQPDCIKVEEKQDVDIALRLELSKLKQQLQNLQQQLLAEQQNNPEPTTTEPNSTPQIAPPVTVEPWDWLEFVVEDDTRQQISEGLVVVMMHRYDCPTCEEMAPAYSEYYREMAEQGVDEFKIAFLSIPPYGDEDHVPEDTPCIIGNLTDEKKWGIMSPLVVALLDGELVKTWEPGTAPKPEKILEEVFGQ